MAEPAKCSARTGKKTDERAASALVAAIKIAPKLSAVKDARARVDEWLGEIARTAAGKALKPLLVGEAKSRRAKLAGVVAAIAETSPYLWDLIRADPDRFLKILQADPEAHFATLVAEVTRAGLAEKDEAEMMRVLRRGKAEAALLIALADIGGVWPVERVTRALTDFADASIGAAVRSCSRPRRARQAQAAPSGRAGGAAPAMSCSRWARWARTSSTIRAIST